MEEGEKGAEYNDDKKGVKHGRTTAKSGGQKAAQYVAYNLGHEDHDWVVKEIAAETTHSEI